MKKLFVYLCMGMMLVSLAACGNGDKTGDSQGSAAGDQIEGSVTAGSQTDSAAGSSDQSASGAGDQTASGSGAADPVQGGAVGDNGHNYEEGWTEEMAGIREAVLEQAGDDYFPNMPLMPDMLEAQFGITADLYEDYFAEMPMISANVDTLLIIKAKDGKVEDVEAALEAYRDVQINGTLQYPANVGIVQASKIETMGNYVCFSQLGGDVMDLMDSGDEAVILHCQELNDLVIGIIRDKVQ
ncbi:MAG: DUF4358 domain-containing protein [Blautia sp.]|nr:DUF4358 domain-containing protein [Blautia sp.]